MKKIIIELTGTWEEKTEALKLLSNCRLQNTGISQVWDKNHNGGYDERWKVDFNIMPVHEGYKAYLTKDGQ